MAHYNRVKYTAANGGTADFVTGGSLVGFRTPATAGVPNGAPISYVAFSGDQAQWETGRGTYSSGSATVSRDTVLESSSAGAKVDFSGAPIVAFDLLAQDIVSGPTSATDNAIARFDGTTGKLLQNSSVTIDDSGNLFIDDGIVFGSAFDTKLARSAAGVLEINNGTLSQLRDLKLRELTVQNPTLTDTVGISFEEIVDPANPTTTAGIIKPGATFHRLYFGESGGNTFYALNFSGVGSWESVPGFRFATDSMSLGNGNFLDNGVTRRGDFIDFAAGGSAGATGFRWYTKSGSYDVITNQTLRMRLTDVGVLQLFNAYTDDSNYECAVFDWQTTTNILTIGTEAAGTGTPRDINIKPASGRLILTGNSIGGTSSGTGFFMGLGYNVVNNKQYWLGDPDYIGNNAATFLRISAGAGASGLQGISGDNAAHRPVYLDNGGNAGVSIGTANVMLFGNNANVLGLGGTTSSFPALKRSSATLQVRLADDSAHADLETKTIRTDAVAVGSLPAAGSKGRRYFVTDANATTFNSIVAGGGANNVPVVDDGTNWRIG